MMMAKCMARIAWAGALIALASTASATTVFFEDFKDGGVNFGTH